MSVQTNRTEPLEESEVFHILGNDRRRAIVQLLAEEGGQIDVSDVATEIAATESDTTPVPNNLYKSVYVSLQQTHLPQLEEDAVIEYDSDAKTIQSGRHFDEVLQYVDGHTDDHSRVLGFTSDSVSSGSRSLRSPASDCRSSRASIRCSRACYCFLPSLRAASISCSGERGAPQLHIRRPSNSGAQRAPRPHLHVYPSVTVRSGRRRRSVPGDC